MFSNDSIKKVHKKFMNFVEEEQWLQNMLDDGWTILSKKGYSKHVFYTDSQNSIRSIFSDTESYKERQKRAMHSSLTNGVISFVFFIISIILYSIFERSAFIGGGLFTFFMSLKLMADYFRHRKALKSLM